ncbi:hypothetical protein BDN72DRAFT_792613 [Pluteus cervinus]|uniref:Uncharacterized protein n=1 Tax=Pluteus cervinus TaxID=181527 RepID=A0ACD3B3B9_9AGAR|nr:hypothetical protein BDN72DRAFT_792613 [Pluteus cervinus]
MEGTQRAIYPILVCQFNYQGHSDDAPHWALVVLISRHVAYIYEVLGGVDNFFFQRRRMETFVGSQTLRGGCKIGEIPADSLDFLEQKLRETPVIRQDPQWTSKTWVVHAIRHLQEYKIVFSHVNERHVRDELASDLKRWHELEDTVVERTYPE